MKWFFGLNEQSTAFDDYSNMLKVAVITAQKLTSLDPHFLYDGEENQLTDWLRRRNVVVIHRRSFLYDKLAEIADKRNKIDYLKIGAGAFLRTEIPQLSIEMSLQDDFVLYTDLDVMFQHDVVPDLQKLSPKYFAVAPEFSKDNYKEMNTGVMLMNLKTLREIDGVFRKFMLANIETLVDSAWDQGAYKRYFKTIFGGFKWDKLPVEFNWKPYWGKNDSAKVIHFHGPKPTQRSLFVSDRMPEAFNVLLPLANADYKDFCASWDEFFAQI